jgi:hypothetical protein
MIADARDTTMSSKDASKKQVTNEKQRGDDAAEFCRTLLRTGEPKQIAASSSEGLAVLVATAIGRCPSCGEIPNPRDAVELIHRVLAAVRGDKLRRFV